MCEPSSIRRIITILMAAILSGCASPNPVMYKEIPSAPYLRQNTSDDAMKTPYLYASHTSIQGYDNIIIDPIEIYKGRDSQFGKMTEEDKTSLGAYMHAQFAEKLASRFRITNTPGPRTLRLKLILTGAAATTPVISTFSRLDLSGGLYNGVQSIRGGEGTFTGSALYAVEVYDSATAQLLCAYIAKEYPNSMNIGASFGSLTAAKVGIEKGAEKFVQQLQQYSK